MAVETDINKRWEQGTPHHPKSEELFSSLADIDYQYGDDSFCWKCGGDGDNGENLMYHMDIHFEREDEILNNGNVIDADYMPIIAYLAPNQDENVECSFVGHEHAGQFTQGSAKYIKATEDTVLLKDVLRAIMLEVHEYKSINKNDTAEAFGMLHDYLLNAYGVKK